MSYAEEESGVPGTVQGMTKTKDGKLLPLFSNFQLTVDVFTLVLRRGLGGYHPPNGLSPVT